MPTLQLKLTPPRSADGLALLARGLTELSTQILGKRREVAYEALSQQLGPLHEASYVVVQEVPAGDWGYGGRTQAQRKAGSPGRTRPAEVTSAA